MPEKKSSFSLSKNLKISQAQQVLLLSVLISSLILGVGIALSLNFLSHISFNAKVIGEKDQAINSYSTAISKIGVCKKPKGETYTSDELKNCNPSTIDVNSIPGTLRYNIVNGLAVNPALNSVSKSEVDIKCVNPESLKNYTIKELNDKYIYATTIEERESATNLLKVCSALRTIPDALPAYKNQEALLSSINKIFNLAGWLPDGLSPEGDGAVSEGSDLSGYSVSFSIDADLIMVQDVLSKIERSIRNIDAYAASISYSDDEALKIDVSAQAYYVNKTELSEETKVIKPSEGKGNK